MTNKKILVSVTNDINNDQRVHKICTSLLKMNFNVTVIGRKRNDSVVLERDYSTHRFNLIFNSGALFYAEYNLRLFFYLLFHRCSVLLANDLDSLLANHLASIIKRVPVVYDSHEYYTEVPELSGRPLVKNIWTAIERICLPKAKKMYTVNESIANLYREKYNKKVDVVRNVPPVFISEIKDINKEKERLGLPLEKKLLIIQGTGINVDRGVEEAVQAMQFVSDALLLIIGSGDVIPMLKKMVMDLRLNEKVKFIAKVPFEELANYTAVCDVGLSLDKDTNMNYRYSLPNKLFNYIQAGVAVLASDLVEVAKIVKDYKVGVIVINHNPLHIAEKLKYLIENDDILRQHKQNSLQAAKELTWEKEEQTLNKIFNEFR